MDGNSNGINFLIYDLKEVLANRIKEVEANRKRLKSIMESSEGILRAEVRLTEPKSIRAYTDKTDTSKQIAVLAKNSRDIFLATFVRVVPFGDFYKKDTATKIIQKEVQDMTLRRRMLRLMALIPKKKSLYLAQKEMNDRNIEKIIAMFTKINVSPVTISKRHEAKYLKNLYSFLL
ncbi:hypothetical protein HSX37_02110|uniref:Uncharacterized protein n=1 Tax=Dendrosporobacter quercicolus TaxID=146817 RepID=A0A1G9LWV5_9FIRM|nr:hypothetical protein [Dendrosporobacter quercicolus]NSL46848.1 hypothetical protein [Dendrosporobacter quercicolus DSM 1736]SDL66426.1 hypothetical protein SAMN04488502_101494 [Dendrosporobacter quercicolus]